MFKERNCIEFFGLNEILDLIVKKIGIRYQESRNLNKYQFNLNFKKILKLKREFLE